MGRWYVQFQNINFFFKVFSVTFILRMFKILSTMGKDKMLVSI